MIAAEFAVRWLALLALIAWLGSLFYLIVAAVILFRHAGPKAGDLIGHCLVAMSRISYAAMPLLAAWAAWAIACEPSWLAWTRAGLLSATFALALATALRAVPAASRERHARNRYSGPMPNPHAARFETLHNRAVRLESVVAAGLLALSVVEVLAVLR